MPSRGGTMLAKTRARPIWRLERTTPTRCTRPVAASTTGNGTALSCFTCGGGVDRTREQKGKWDGTVSGLAGLLSAIGKGSDAIVNRARTHPFLALELLVLVRHDHVVEFVVQIVVADTTNSGGRGRSGGSGG